MSEHRLTQHVYRGRTWLLVGREPYTRKDDSTTELLRWQAPCGVCGSLFEIRTPVAYESSKAFAAVHCAAHRLAPTQVSQLRIEAKAARRVGAK